MAHIFAHITCTRVKWEVTMEELAKGTGKTPEQWRAELCDDSSYDAHTDTVRSEDGIEESGWIDRSWSRRVLHDSRNDVSPAVDADESDLTTLADETADVLGWLEGGFEDYGSGTFYASESYVPFDDPWDYSYAVHFVQKFYGPDGWSEKPWHPVRDGKLPGDENGKPDVKAIQDLSERESMRDYYVDKAERKGLMLERQHVVFPDPSNAMYAEIDGIDADEWLRNAPVKDECPTGCMCIYCVQGV